jgi:hypothetical protein
MCSTSREFCLFKNVETVEDCFNFNELILNIYEIAEVFFLPTTQEESFAEVFFSMNTLVLLDKRKFESVYYLAVPDDVFSSGLVNKRILEIQGLFQSFLDEN